jgi:hypothetical protein
MIFASFNCEGEDKKVELKGAISCPIKNKEGYLSF